MLAAAAVLTAAQLGTYDQVKSSLKARSLLEEGLVLHASASIVAGFAAAVATAPIDTAKTRIMTQRAARVAPGAGTAAAVRHYTGTLNCIAHLWRTEGLVLGLYAGFTQQWLRIGPHTIITLMLYEKLRVWAGYRPV